MSYSISTREIDEIPFLFMRDRVERSQIGDALARMFPAIAAYATETGISLAGRPLVRYIAMNEDGLSIEAGIPVARGAEGTGEIHAGTIPAGKVAVTLHKGPYEELYTAHVAMEQWLKENGVEATGPPWESYVNDPGEVPDPADYETEILVPIRSE